MFPQNIPHIVTSSYWDIARALCYKAGSPMIQEPATQHSRIKWEYFYCNVKWEVSALLFKINIKDGKLP